MGSSRSASVIIYYLMKFYGKSFEDALQYVKHKRDIVNLNINFANELRNIQNINDL